MLLRTDSAHPDFKNLVSQLDAYLSDLNGPEHAFYNQFNQIESLQQVVVAYQQGEPVGCGAFKRFNETTVELKRMFVVPRWRGKGIAGEVLRELEAWSYELGFSTIVLETAIDLPSALRLYAKNGYLPIPNYPPYVDLPRSRCLQKTK